MSKAHEQKLQWEKLLADGKYIMHWKANKFFRLHSLAVEVRAMNLTGVAITSSMRSDKYVQSWGHGPHDDRDTRHLNALSNVSSAKLWGRHCRHTCQIDYRKMGDRASMSPETLVTKVRDGRAND